MRPTDILGEALRNLWWGVSKPVTMALAFVFLIGGIALLDARVLVDANNQVTAWRDTGSAIIVANYPGMIDGAACDALSSTEGILNAGAGRLLTKGITLEALPLGTPTFVEVTPGFAVLISTTAGGATAPLTDTTLSLTHGGILLSEALATSVDRGPGSTLATKQGQARVAAVFAVPDDGRPLNLSYSAMAQVPPTGVFDFCWIEVWPPSDTTTNLIRSVALPGGNNTITVAQLNTTSGKNLNVDRLYAHRITRYAPVACALIGLLLGWIAVRIRRLELASTLHAGVSRPALAYQIMIETTLWLVGALCILAPLLWFGATLNNTLPTNFALLPPLIAVALGLAATWAGTALGLAATHENHLFHYFKNR